jgi:signal transduction histidine kinase/ligand-binding sensor domain-containing protein
MKIGTMRVTISPEELVKGKMYQRIYISVVPILLLVLILFTTAFSVISSPADKTYPLNFSHGKPVTNNISIGSSIPGDLNSVNRLDEESEGGIKFERFSSEEGLSPGSIMNICQDSMGFLWIATSHGLNRYDGFNFKEYLNDPDDEFSLSNNNVWAVYEDSKGVLWAGTFGGGLNRYDRDNDRFIRYQYDPEDPRSLSTNVIYNIYEDSTGNLWIATLGGGLNRYDRQNNQFVRYMHDPANPFSVATNDVLTLAEDESGVLWVGVFGGGLHRYDPEIDGFIRYQHDPRNPLSISSDNVVNVYADSQGVIWVGTDGGGLNSFNPETEAFFVYQYHPYNIYSLSHEIAFVTIEDAQGGLWVGTMGGGLNLFDRQSGNFTRFQYNPDDAYSLNNDYINTLFVDREGNLWIGTTTGLNKLSWEKNEFYPFLLESNDSNTIINEPTYHLYEDSEGNLWIGTEIGLYYLDSKSGDYTLYTHNPDDPNSISDDWITYILEDSQGQIWLGTQSQGVDRFDRESGVFHHYVKDSFDSQGWRENHISVIYEDSQGVVWIGTQGGLIAYDPDTERIANYHFYPGGEDRLTKQSVADIIEGPDGLLWISFWNEGLVKFDPYSGVVHEPNVDNFDPENLKGQLVDLFFMDSAGRLWLWTPDRGLLYYDPQDGDYIEIGVPEGFPELTVHNILEDSQGYLWLSTTEGIIRFDTFQNTFTRFFAEDGFTMNEFSNTGVYLSDGSILLGGTGGVTIFNPQDININTYQPPIALTSLQQSGEDVEGINPIEQLDEITLLWPNNDFEFEFASLSFVQPEKNQFAYMLEGYDQDWNYIGNRNFGRYTSLPGGTYTLRLIGSNNDGMWNEDGASVRITIQPPFWQTWWFWGSVLLLAFGSVVGISRMRVRSVEARSLELEVLVSERTKEIDHRRKELEALYLADERMHRFLNLDQVLKALVDVSVDILGADKSSVFVWDNTRDRVMMSVERGFSPQAVEKITFERGEGIVGYVFASGQAVIVEDVSTDSSRGDEREDIIEAVLAENVRSFMQIPITIDGEVFGVYNVCFSEPHAFGDDERRLFTALAQRAALAIDNAQLYESSQQLAVIEERARLARDLHDSSKQKAFAALAQLGAASGLVKKNPDAAETNLEEAESLVHDVLQELTILIQEMQPAALKERGLTETLRVYVFEWAEQNDVEVHLHLQDGHKLPLKMEQSLYRTVQEALANVSRHSHARSVDISLVYEDGCAAIMVTDDGVGFDPLSVTSGMGLRSMRERAEQYQGTFTIQSLNGKGTSIISRIPLPEDGFR